MLINSPKISDLTKREVFQLNLSQNYGEEEHNGSGFQSCLVPVNTLTYYIGVSLLRVYPLYVNRDVFRTQSNNYDEPFSGK